MHETIYLVFQIDINLWRHGVKCPILNMCLTTIYSYLLTTYVMAMSPTLGYVYSWHFKFSPRRLWRLRLPVCDVMQSGASILTF